MFLSLKPSHSSLQPPHSILLHSACVPFSLTQVPSALDPLCLVGGDGHGGPELCLASLSHPPGLCCIPLSMPSLLPSLFPPVMVSHIFLFHPPFPSCLSQSTLKFAHSQCGCFEGENNLAKSSILLPPGKQFFIWQPGRPQLV